MRDGNVPRFFCAAGGWRAAQLVGQLAEPAKQDPAFQLAAVPAFHDIAGAERKGGEDGKRGGEEESGGDGRRWKIIG